MKYKGHDYSQKILAAKANADKALAMPMEVQKLQIIFLEIAWVWFDSLTSTVQWNLVIKRSDITNPCYNKVLSLVPALYISLFFYPDIMRNLI